MSERKLEPEPEMQSESIVDVDEKIKNDVSIIN